MTTRKTRLSLLALAATATVAMTALAPSTASAWGRVGYHRAFGWHPGVHHFGHYNWGYRHAYWWGRYHYPYRWWRWYRWTPRPIVYGAVGAVGGAAVASAPAVSSPAPARPANCLVKQYLPNGAVAFADTCTNEQAVSAPNSAPQGQPAPGGS